MTKDYLDFKSRGRLPPNSFFSLKDAKLGRFKKAYILDKVTLTAKIALVATILVGSGLILGQYLTGFQLLSHSAFFATKITTGSLLTLGLAIGATKLQILYLRKPKEE